MNEKEFYENNAEDLIKDGDENFMLGRFLDAETGKSMELVPEESD